MIFINTPMLFVNNVFNGRLVHVFPDFDREMADKTHQYPSKGISRPAGFPAGIGPRPKELDDFVSVRPLTFKEKFIIKTKENPFVPIGGALTVVALSMGIFNLYKGNSKKQQLFMRFRVGAQAFTVAALVLGVVYHNTKKR